MLYAYENIHIVYAQYKFHIYLFIYLLAFDSAHVKRGVWPRPKLKLVFPTSFPRDQSYTNLRYTFDKIPREIWWKSIVSIQVFICRENSRRSGILLNFYRPSQILPIFEKRYVYLWWGTWRPAMLGIGYERNPSPTDADVPDVPDVTSLSFHLPGMISDHRRNLGRVVKIETLPILQVLQICPRSSQTIEDIYDFDVISQQNLGRSGNMQ